jgi:hypothetical protein
MKALTRVSLWLIIIWAVLSTRPLCAQGLTQPLRFQGLDHLSSPGARSRALGGSAVAWSVDPTSLFSNPANLVRLTSVQVMAGATFRSSLLEQQQDWIPDRLYAELSLVFENNFAGIKDSGLHKPYDAIGPDWKEKVSSFRPSMVAAAMPIVQSPLRVVGGIGYSEVANLDFYYQNNNVLNPNIGAFRPEPILRPRAGDTLNVQWYQSVSRRTGSLYGITPGLAIQLSEDLSVGFAATIYTGSVDDEESRLDRGLLRLTATSSGSFNNFVIVPAAYRTVSTGTSKFTGTQLSVAGLFQQPYYSIGLQFSPSMSIMREWTRAIMADSASRSFAVTSSGEDEIRLPLHFALGIALHPTDRWTLLADYDVRSYKNVEVIHGDSTVSPWLGSSVLHLGAAYQALDWMELRIGYFEDVQTFAPVGDGLINDPARGSVYSFGIGLKAGHVGVDLAYELSTLSYNDMWVSNVNQNHQKHDRLTVEAWIQF